MFSELSLKNFIEKLSSPDPTPGGGSASSFVAAFGFSLVSMVLYADSRIDPKTNKPEYFFNTYQENASAKCPPDIFGEDVLRIPNDLNLILEKTQEYVR